jgi:hypothetical protein
MDGEIDHQGAEHKEDRRGDQIRHQGLALMLVEPRRHEQVNLRGDEGETEEDGTEEGQVEFGEEQFLGRGIDQLDLVRGVAAVNAAIWPEQHVENVLRDEEAADHQHDDGNGTFDEPLAQFDQVFKKRRLAAGEFVFDFGLVLVFELRLIGVGHSYFVSAGSAGFLRGARGFFTGAAGSATASTAAAALARGLRAGLAAGATSALTSSGDAVVFAAGFFAAGAFATVAFAGAALAVAGFFAAGFLAGFTSATGGSSAEVTDDVGAAATVLGVTWAAFTGSLGFSPALKL